MSATVLDVGRRFATALDAEDYSAATALLADNCIYHSRSETFLGPSAIVASYQGIGATARDQFDAIDYTSAIAAAGPGEAVIEFTDSLQHAGRRHVYRCRQLIRVDEHGVIVEITHQELPGERKRLEEFLNEVL
jgi:hypothetical protein